MTATAMHLLMIVEDDTPTATALQRLLSPHAETVHAASVFQAQGLLSRCIPTVVILDYHLPDGTGIDLAQWMQHQPDLMSTRRIAYSSYPREHIIRRAHDLFDAYAEKSNDHTDLLRVLLPLL